MNIINRRTVVLTATISPLTHAQPAPSTCSGISIGTQPGLHDVVNAGILSEQYATA